MKALILSLEKGKAIVLLRGGEMRTVRARSGWSVGQEIDLKAAAGAQSRGSAMHVFVPMAACAAVLVLLIAGFYRLGGENIDQTFQPLSSGSMAAENTPEATQSGGIVIEETQTLEPIETPVPAAVTAAPASPTRHHDEDASDEYCDECGQRGHDDDDCPYQICDECRRQGHDDDDCPYEFDDDDDDD